MLRRTGTDPVDLVAHSVGSLPTRWYVKYGGASEVRNGISLTAP